MKMLRLLPCLMGSLGVVVAQLAPKRQWTGVNGKTISGSFCLLTPDREKAEILLDNGQKVMVALSNLIPADQEIALSGEKSAAPDEASFKPMVNPNRKLMIPLDPKKFGYGVNSAMIDTIWMSFLWWDQTGVLEIPKKGDFKTKAESLYKKLTRYVLKGEDNLYREDAKKGVEAYFKAEYEKVAACQIFLETKDYSLARLCSLAQGANVVLLQMTMEYKNGKDYTMVAALESISEDGVFVFHLEGRRMTGKLVETEFNGSETQKAKGCEWVLDHPDELPEYARGLDARLYLGKSKWWNAVIVMKPYVYMTPGKVVPLPPP